MAGDKKVRPEGGRHRPRESRPGAIREACFVAYLVENADRRGLISKKAAEIITDARCKNIYEGTQPMIWLHSNPKKLIREGVISYYNRLGKSYQSPRKVIGMHVWIRLENPEKLKSIIRTLPSVRPEAELLSRIDTMALRERAEEKWKTSSKTN